jgi:hypothetical protein
MTTKVYKLRIAALASRLIMKIQEGLVYQVESNAVNIDTLCYEN